MRFTGFANPADLDEILDSDAVRVVSPFLSSITLDRISSNRHKSFSLITRLPTSYNSPIAFIENDPAPIIAAIDRMGTKLRILALPSVHSKIFLNENYSWTGSANFTNNGFSGKPELLIRFDGVEPNLDKIFEKYEGQSYLVSKSKLLKLQDWINKGLTEIDSRASRTHQTPDEPEAGVVSYSDFLKWLGSYNGKHKNIATILADRADGGNQMSGHVALAFNGVTSFLRKNPEIRRIIDYKNWTQAEDSALMPLANFIKKYGDEYRGPRGGFWRKYLSTDLGGRQVNGGAGNSIVKRSVLLLPQYLDERGL